MAKQIGILLFPDVEELDAVGPWEVFAFWARTFPEDGYAVSCFSQSGGLVQCAKGLTIQAHHSYADVPPLDVLLYPGGQGTRRQLHDENQLAWLRKQRETVPLLASVCTGSLVFAAAGLLKNRPATTHWNALTELAAIDPSIDLRADDRVVDDGDVVTCAGVSAGIDLALHLVSRLASPERAQQVRRGIQYEPPAVASNKRDIAGSTPAAPINASDYALPPPVNVCAVIDHGDDHTPPAIVDSVDNPKIATAGSVKTG